jgi:hypothetical protein
MIYHFSDAVSQYKIRTNLFNLCSLKDNFGMYAKWNFFAALYGKGTGGGQNNGNTKKFRKKIYVGHIERISFGSTECSSSCVVTVHVKESENGRLD